MKRRQFLQSSPALLGVPALAATPPLPLSIQPLHPRARPKRMRTDHRVALIGTGWYGKMDLFRLLQVAEVEVVALCDVDRRQLEDARERLTARHPEQAPRLYAKHEEMLRVEKPDLVLIETPDHWHARQAIDCLVAGCHLYLQKPISRTIKEAKRIWATARRSNGVIQVALQRRSTPHLVEMKRRFVDSGLIGDVHHVDMCCYYHMRDDAVREVRPVPDFFDYERWTGPAERLPYKGLPHRRWRAFRAYGGGIVGDMCVHYLDAVRWLLGLGAPTEISSRGGIYVDTEADATTTDTQTAVFTYPERGLNVHWTHRAWGAAPDPEWPWAFTLYGTGGTLVADTHKYEWRPGRGEDPDTYVRGEALIERDAYPEDLDEEGVELHVTSAVRAHMRDWLEAIAEGRPPVASLEEGYISTVACLRANEDCWGE